MVELQRMLCIGLGNARDIIKALLYLSIDNMSIHNILSVR